MVGSEGQRPELVECESCQRRVMAAAAARVARRGGDVQGQKVRAEDGRSVCAQTSGGPCCVPTKMLFSDDDDI